MSASVMPLVTLITALGCAAIGGVFFAFSNFVMKALARLPAAEGIRAMQSINVTVLNKWFLGVFLGTALGCLLVGLLAVAWPAPGWVFRLGGAALYLVGTLAVTRAFNIPRNTLLAKLDADNPEAKVAWSRYVSEWTSWNHVRGVAAVAAAALLTAGLLMT
jgi:uncharacterized membrane protein